MALIPVGMDPREFARLTEPRTLNGATFVGITTMARGPGVTDPGSPEGLAEARRFVDANDVALARARAIGFAIDDTFEGQTRGADLLELAKGISDPMLAIAVIAGIQAHLREQPENLFCLCIKDALVTLRERREHDYIQACRQWEEEHKGKDADELAAWRNRGEQRRAEATVRREQAEAEGRWYDTDAEDDNDDSLLGLSRDQKGETKEYE